MSGTERLSLRKATIWRRTARAGGDGRAAATGRGQEEGRGGVIQATEVPGEGVDGGGGIAETTGDLCRGGAFEKERPQQFVEALARMAGTGKEVGRRGQGWIPN